MSVESGLERLVGRTVEIAKAVVAYRAALMKEGVPEKELSSMVSMYQASLIGAVLRGEDGKNFLDLG